MASKSQTLNDFAQQLEAPQRFIKIFIADRDSPYLMPESILINSSEYFANAIEHENSLGGSEPGVLRFPDDSGFEEAWKILLYWIVDGRLPMEYQLVPVEAAKHHTDGKLLNLVRSWALGDKYRFPDLQDAIMLELLQHCKHVSIIASHGEIYAMLQVSPVGSSLRRLLVEEVVYTHESELANQKPTIGDYLEVCDGVFGLAGSLVNAHQASMGHEYQYPRTSYCLGTKMQAWKEYLQGPWPSVGWEALLLFEAGMQEPDQV